MMYIIVQIRDESTCFSIDYYSKRLLSTNLYSQTRIEDYVEFLKEQKSEGVHFSTLKDADIIVLGERDHRDTTNTI